MNNRLVRVLTTIASDCVHASTTESVYFQIGCIKVRVSDHLGPLSQEDLAIFPVSKVYVVFPTVGTFHQVQFFTSVKAVVEFISDFERFAVIFVKGSQKLNQTNSPSSLPEIISKDQWKKQLSSWYNCKQFPLVQLLETLYNLTTNNQKDQLLSDLKSKGPLNAQAKYDYLTTLIDGFNSSKK